MPSILDLLNSELRKELITSTSLQTGQSTKKTFSVLAPFFTRCT